MYRFTQGFSSIGDFMTATRSAVADSSSLVQALKESRADCNAAIDRSLDIITATRRLIAALRW